MLVWHAARSGAVDLRLYRVDALEPIPLRDTAWPERNVVRRPALEHVRLPRLSAGVHEGHTPRTHVDIDELLVLAAVPSRDDDDPALAIYAWEPARGTVTVLPQRWLTPATHDLGYEWVTQVVRNPSTGRIVGDGIRLGTFELDDDGTRVRTWFTGAWGELLDDGRASA